MPSKKIVPLVVAVFAALMLLPATGSAREVGAKLQAAIDVKILSFDSSLRHSSGAQVTIAVVYQAGNRDSESAANEMASQFNALGRRVTVHGKRLRAILLPVGTDLSWRLRSDQVSAIYVASGVDDIATIASAAASNNVRTLCGDRSYLARGIAIAVIEKGGRPSIVVHARHARRTGMMLDPKLLRLAEVIH